MLSALLAAALVLGPRPPELVKPGEAANYAAWIGQEARKQAGYYAHKDCGTASLRPKSFAPVSDAAIAQVRPGAHQYLEILEVEGCGVAGIQGLVVFREPNWWRALPTAPGESVATLAQQRDVLPSVILAVKAAAEKDTSCSALEKAQSALVYDTRITRPGGPAQPWSERWFMAVCGAGYKIDIDFTPGASSSGGATWQVRVAP